MIASPTTLDELSAQLHADGYRPLAIAWMADLRVLAAARCGVCDHLGLTAHPFYRHLPGECRLGPCRLLASCPHCGHCEEP